MNDVPPCDLLLFVTTQSEVEALAKVSEAMQLPMRKEASRLGEYFDLGYVGADRVLAVKTRMGAIEHRGSTSKAILFQGATQAAGIVQVGMAFGCRPAEQEYGDVLVSNSLIPYDARDVTVVDGVERVDYGRAKPAFANEALVRRFQVESRRVRREFKVHIGAILSGSARIFSRRYRDHLVESVPVGKGRVIVGGEMEGVGLLAVSPRATPTWCVVKGISDFADENRDGMIEQKRAPACENAIQFVLSTLATAPVRNL